jgi:hypothetical protein
MSDAEHGTYAGYNQHKFYRSEPCDACRRANVSYRRQWRQRGRCVPGLGWPLGPGDIAPARKSERPRALKGTAAK